jgi:hypothetical protein
MGLLRWICSDWQSIANSVKSERGSDPKKGICLKKASADVSRVVVIGLNWFYC